ncbi:hypothetical protein PV325_004492 [Microctonus aethiopoides]|nr:hypothetical protein PV325_004492 [Microctonus aethiopoides]
MRASALEEAKLYAGILEEVAKRTLWSKLSSRRHSGYCCGAEDSCLSCRVEDRLVSIVAWVTLYATPWVTYHRFNAEND